MLPTQHSLVHQSNTQHMADTWQVVFHSSAAAAYYALLARGQGIRHASTQMWMLLNVPYLQATSNATCCSMALAETAGNVVTMIESASPSHPPSHPPLPCIKALVPLCLCITAATLSSQRPRLVRGAALSGVSLPELEEDHMVRYAVQAGDGLFASAGDAHLTHEPHAHTSECHTPMIPSRLHSLHAPSQRRCSGWPTRSTACLQ